MTSMYVCIYVCIAHNIHVDPLSCRVELGHAANILKCDQAADGKAHEELTETYHHLFGAAAS